MKHLRLGGLSRLRLSRYREASGADDPITRWDMRLPMDAAIYRGLEEILGKRSGEEALPKIHATRFKFLFLHMICNFHFSPQLGAIGSLHWPWLS